MCFCFLLKWLLKIIPEKYCAMVIMIGRLYLYIVLYFILIA